jgi:hypothetical protein
MAIILDDFLAKFGKSDHQLWETGETDSTTLVELNHTQRWAKILTNNKKAIAHFKGRLTTPTGYQPDDVELIEDDQNCMIIMHSRHINRLSFWLKQVK